MSDLIPIVAGQFGRWSMTRLALPGYNSASYHEPAHDRTPRPGYGATSTWDSDQLGELEPAKGAVQFLVVITWKP